LTSSNPADLGWLAVRTGCPMGWAENFWVGATGLAWEVTVKVYGVTVTMPQG
jgi:hypothetical protein